MAWSDKPTPAQLGYLAGEYESILIEELDNAKNDGDTHKAEVIQKALDDDVVRKAIEALPTRSDVSAAIEAAENRCEVDGRVLALLSHYFEPHDVKIDYERVRRERQAERVRTARGGRGHKNGREN